MPCKPTAHARFVGFVVMPKVINQIINSDLALVINRHDIGVLRSRLTNRKATVAKLIERIIHEWAIHPARFQGNLPLPAQNSVLLKGESLRSYIHRATLAVITTVRKQEGSWGKTADCLGYERTSFAKLRWRLKKGKGPPAFHLEYVNDSQGLLPLTQVIHDHVNSALRLCNGNQEQACHVLGIPLSRLNLILLAARTETEYELLLRTDNRWLSDPE